MPSIACLEQTASNKWDYYFVLVDPGRIYSKEKPAVSQAEMDLEAAFLQKRRSGSDYAVGECLRDKGYVSVKQGDYPRLNGREKDSRARPD
jgi:hypothetical protein